MIKKTKRTLSPEHLEKLRLGRLKSKEPISNQESVPIDNTVPIQEPAQIKETILPTQEPEQISTTAPTPKPAPSKPVYYHHDSPFEIYLLDNYLNDPRIGHLDMAYPNLDNLIPGQPVPIQPFGKLISIFIYRPYIEMDGIYDTNSNNIVGDIRALEYRPGLGNLEPNVFRSSTPIGEVPIPVKFNKFNPITGKVESEWDYDYRKIIINNEFSHVVPRQIGQIYSTKDETTGQGIGGMKITQILNTANSQYIPPVISEVEANAILTGRYTNKTETLNITACNATKQAIRNSSEYIKGNIQEYIFMSRGEEVYDDTFTKTTKTIRAQDNITFVAVQYNPNFSIISSNTDEAKENNKGYLVIDDRVIANRKAHLSQIQSKAIINTQAEYGADQETIKKALDAYYKNNQQ